MRTHINHPSRRSFIRATALGAGALVTAPSLLRTGLAAATARTVEDRITLGRTGIKASFLAQGTGYNGYDQTSAQTRAGKESFDRLVRTSLDRGVNFMDMADLYGSHPFVRDVVKGIQRDRLVMLSKIWPTETTWNKPSGGAVPEVERFLKELDTDHLDICLIHCMTNDRWAAAYEHIRDELATLKQQGKVRAVGVSCHDFGALKVAAEHPWVDVILARINHKGGKEYSCDASVEELMPVLKQARANGKVVLGMKIFGAGKLTSPEDKDASLKFVVENGLVDAITIGTTDPGQVEDTVARVNKALAA
ncbi:MAG: aldo/keto reductase [Verrucomicrobiales bacterium]|nr:aldo/keto reductase [Verrucomicrobiales bacterium]